MHSTEKNTELLLNIILFFLFPYLAPEQITKEYVRDLKSKHISNALLELIENRNDFELFIKSLVDICENDLLIPQTISINRRFIFLDDLQKLDQVTSKCLVSFLISIYQRKLPVFVLLSGQPHFFNNGYEFKYLKENCVIIRHIYEIGITDIIAIKDVSSRDNIFSYGVSDKKVGGLDVHKPNGNISPLYPAALSENVPEPFKSEPTGGGGTRMHHKFIVIDFNKTNARVYLGSYNFSKTADTKNGENLIVIRDRKIAVSYMIDLLCLIDPYHFRVTQKETAKKELILSKPPRSADDIPWWSEYYTDEIKIQDRTLFA